MRPKIVARRERNPIVVVEGCQSMNCGFNEVGLLVLSGRMGGRRRER